MRTFPIVVFCLLLFAAGALADEAAPPPRAEPLHFRLEIGVEEPLAVAGYLDETGGTGTGYDVARLDLDGDGVFETEQPFAAGTDPRTKREFRDAKITVEKDGATWQIDLYALRFRRPTIEDGRADATFRWSVTKGDFYAWFINGRIPLFTSAKAAAEEMPVILGRNFAFEVTATTRGPQALLNVGLKDPNGGTLRLARVGKEERAPSATLDQCCCERVEVNLSYG